MARRGGSTGAWRTLREQCFNTFGRSCLVCSERATEVDHIIEVADGGEDTLSNLQPLCKSCHARKTAANRLKRRAVFSNSSATPDSLYVSFSPMKRFDPPMSQG